MSNRLKTRTMIQPKSSMSTALIVRELEPRIILIKGKPRGKSFIINEGDNRVGREIKNIEISLFLEKTVSRNHALLTRVSSGQGESATEKVILTDTESSNGTFRNGDRLPPNQPVELGSKDIIQFGDTSFIFLPRGKSESKYIQEMLGQNTFDSLTQVYNKGFLLENLEYEFQRAKELAIPLSVVFFDLDHFKKVNDTYGHAAGDYVLKEFAAHIKEDVIRPTDLLVRYGGEEFVLLLPGIEIDGATKIAERIRQGIEQKSFVFEGKRIPITTSLGVSTIRPHHSSADDFLVEADQALYQSKHGGRNRVTVSQK